MADDRAEQLKRDADKVTKEIADRVRADVKKTGDLSRVHPLPPSSHDVPDDLDARLVVIGTEHPYSREAGNDAEVFAKSILESRGNSPRIYKNSLVFLAVDKTRLQDLDEAVRRYLAWESILDEKDKLNLSPHQVKQAEQQRDGSQRHRDGTHTGSLSMAARSHAVYASVSCRMAKFSPHGPRCAGGAGEQETKER